jgi:signal transduction histidine kinase
MNRAIHEIRNHLAVAVANIEAFRDGVLDLSPARVRAVLQALEEVDVLLDDLPRDYRIDRREARPRTIDVCQVIANEVLALEASAREAGVAFSVHLCDRPRGACSAFYGDPVQIAEAVNNIVSNAIRYTPAGACVEVDCRHEDASIALTVVDEGPGVRAEEMHRIFELGFRGSASASRPGSGFGLALSKRFVEAHGGTITVSNAVRGARFVVRLPVTDAGRDGCCTIDGAVSLL